MAPIECAEPTPGDNPGYRAGYGQCDCSDDYGCLKLSFRAAIGGVDRSRSPAEFFGRQGASWQDHEAGRSLHPPLAGDWGNGCIALQSQVESCLDTMGDGIAGAKTRQSGGCRTGQQDGADRLGFDDERDQLQDRDELTNASRVFEPKRIGEVLMV